MIGVFILAVFILVVSAIVQLAAPGTMDDRLFAEPGR